LEGKSHRQFLHPRVSYRTAVLESRGNALHVTQRGWCKKGERSRHANNHQKRSAAPNPTCRC
jgi:hypothetical protein